MAGLKAKKPTMAGFTLIELVIVMGIMVILGIFIAGSLGSLFRTSNRTARWQMVKNEGDRVVEVIGRMARLSDRGEDCVTDSYMTILNADGGMSRFMYDITNQKIASVAAGPGEDIGASTDITDLHSTNTKVTEFSLDCSGFSKDKWGSWVNMSFTMQDTIDPSDPVEIKFSNGIGFRNK
ncbi:MAG: type II secretion system protein [bacterium]|nr:type II secretion system protein [bacterium]